MTEHPHRAGFIGAIAFVLACAAFAGWPIRHDRGEPPVIDRPARVETTPVAALDTAAFRVPIWVADPAPPSAPTTAMPPPPPPPLKLQLLAIVKEGNGEDATCRAAVYDPDSDKLLVVGAGEKIGLRTVDKVAKGSVTLRDDTGDRTLALKDGTPP